MNSQTTSAEPIIVKKPVTIKRQSALPQLAKKTDSSQIKEVYESILWRINAKRSSNETLAIGVTGCLKKSGSTTVATNLAIHASNLQNGRVLLIDASWQMPGLMKKFGLAKDPGLYDALSGELSPRECQPQAVTEYLDVLCRGKWDEEQPALVRQELAAEMLEELKTEYGMIVVDLPPAEKMRSALAVARELDATLLVSRFESVSQEQAQRALRRLQEDGVTVWGSILNRHREYIPRWLRNWL